MRSYEAMFIFKANLKEEEQKVLISELENILKKNQTEIENMQLFGRRHLAYEINKNKEGLYYLMNFSGQDPSVVSKLKQFCNINENVLRTLIIKKKPKKQDVR